MGGEESRTLVAFQMLVDEPPCVLLVACRHPLA